MFSQETSLIEEFYDADDTHRVSVDGVIDKEAPTDLTNIVETGNNTIDIHNTSNTLAKLTEDDGIASLVEDTAVSQTETKPVVESALVEKTNNNCGKCK